MNDDLRFLRIKILPKVKVNNIPSKFSVSM